VSEIVLPVLLTVRSSRDVMDRDDPHGAGHSHGAAANDIRHEHRDYRKKRFDRNYNKDDDDKDGINIAMICLQHMADRCVLIY